MTDDEIDKFRTAERARMAPMREAARKEAFVQGWIAAHVGDPAYAPDDVILKRLREADSAYLLFASKRGPA